MTRWTLWTKVLFIEGLVLLGLGFGWGLGTRAGTGLMPVIILVVAGFLALFASMLLWRGLNHRLYGHAAGRLIPIDLEESERALRAFGVQAPIYEGTALRTEHVMLRRGKELRGLHPPLIVEHWGGDEIVVNGGQGGTPLRARQILKIERLPHDSKFNIALAAPPGEAFLVLHFLSADERLQ